MAHAVIDHFEAVKIQKQNREQGILLPLRMLDEPSKPVDEQQPVWQARKRIRYLSFRDVRLRPGHSQCSSGIVDDGEASIQHPAKRAVLVEHPMLALEM